MTRYQMRKKFIASVIPALVSPASCLQCFTQCLSQFRVTVNRRIFQRIIMNITIYLGASSGNDNTLPDAVRSLGTWIGQSGNTLVYGGSKTGLMGVLAESVIESGGEVIGVEPLFFVRNQMQYEKLSQLIITSTMAERKEKMIGLGEVFIAMPGGTGTLEEISEIMSKQALGFISGPCIFYNHNGYYDDLKHMLAKMTEQGFSDRYRQRNIHFADSISGITEIIKKMGMSRREQQPE